MSKSEQFGNSFFYFVFILWFSSEILMNSSIKYIYVWKKDDVNSAIAVFILVLTVVQISTFQRYTFKEIVFLFIIMIPFALGTINSNHNYIMSTMLFIIAAKNVSIDRIIVYAYVVLLVMLGVVLFLCQNGIIHDVIMYRGSMIRHSLGFSDPNWLGVLLFQVALSHCYIRKNKMNIYDILFVLLIGYIIYTVPNCQTAYITLGAFLVFIITYKTMGYFEGGEEFFSKIMIATYIVANLGSLFLSYINCKSIAIFAKWDQVMSHRFTHCHRVWQRYGVTLLGQTIELYTRKMGNRISIYYLDTAYVTILLRYGIIVYLIFSALYLYCMKYWISKKNYMMVMILASYSIYGIMENSFFSLARNFFLIGLAYVIYSKDYSNDEVLDKKEHTRIRFKFLTKYAYHGL